MKNPKNPRNALFPQNGFPILGEKEVITAKRNRAKTDSKKPKQNMSEKGKTNQEMSNQNSSKMSEMECPICYTDYMEQPEKLDGKCKSKLEDFNETKCRHCVCIKCCQQLYNNLRKEWKNLRNIEYAREHGFSLCNAKCPLCREDWTLWLLRSYEDEEEDEDEEEEE